jgi:hypothetical protein
MITGSGHMLMLQVPLTLPAIVGLRRLARVSCRPGTCTGRRDLQELTGRVVPRTGVRLLLQSIALRPAEEFECGHLILEGMRQR